jgi:hypothetical protein
MRTGAFGFVFRFNDAQVLGVVAKNVHGPVGHRGLL